MSIPNESTTSDQNTQTSQTPEMTQSSGTTLFNSLFSDLAKQSGFQSAGDGQQGTKRAREGDKPTPNQPAQKKPLTPDPTALDDKLDNDTPIMVDPAEFRRLHMQNIELQKAAEKIKRLEEENSKWEELGRASGTNDLDGAREIIKKATEQYTEKEVGKIKEAVTFIADLVKRTEDTELKNHLIETGKNLEKLAQDREQICSTMYAKKSKPIISTMVAASYDIGKHLKKAKSEMETWKQKYEEERAVRVKLEEYNKIMQRGDISSTSWNVHASRDTPRIRDLPHRLSQPFGLGNHTSFNTGSSQKSMFDQTSSRFSNIETTTGQKKVPVSSIPGKSGIQHSTPSVNNVKQQQQQQTTSQSCRQLEFNSIDEVFRGHMDPQLLQMRRNKMVTATTFSSGGTNGDDDHVPLNKIVQSLSEAKSMPDDVSKWRGILKSQIYDPLAGRFVGGM